MAYTIFYNFGGNAASNFSIADGTLNTANTSLQLPGRNYAGYGSPVDQSLVDMTQHFARSTGNSGPVNAMTGQLWYDVTNTSLKLNVSTSNVANTVSWQPVHFGNSIIAGIYASNGVANVTASGTISGNWTLTAGSRLNATYADLAERFEADRIYDYGTVVELGGEKEITAVKQDASETVFGVISDTAGYLMNALAGDDKTHPPVAMTGRVAVKVLGRVKKGDRLISAGDGLARAAQQGEATAFNTIGRALEDKIADDQGKVLAAVSAKL
jgi:hypothetical protein